MKPNKKLDEAISRLADMFENGHLIAMADPAEFLNIIADKLSRENQQEYEPGDFCRNAGCENFVHESCVCEYPTDCIRTAIEFNDWIKQNGYRIAKDAI